MEIEEAISEEEFAARLCFALKEAFGARTRKYRDEIHVKLKNGQKFLLAVCGIDKDESKTDKLPVTDLSKLSEEEYNKRFEEMMMNWIGAGAWLMLEAEVEQKDGVTYIPLKTGREYAVVIQKR